MNHNRFSKFIDTQSTFFHRIERSTASNTFYKTKSNLLSQRTAFNTTSGFDGFKGNFNDNLRSDLTPVPIQLENNKEAEKNELLEKAKNLPKVYPDNLTLDEKVDILQRLKDGYNPNSRLKLPKANSCYKKSLLLKDEFSANISKAETDDTIFALSEIKLTDSKISKRLNNGQVWRKKNENIYDAFASNNHKLIKDVQRRVRMFGGWGNFDLEQEVNHKKYFSMDKVNVIKDAERILNEKALYYLNEKKAFENLPKGKDMTLYTFTTQNRKIFLDNILLNILNDERRKLIKNEKEIEKALKSAKNEFNKDEKAFEDFKIMKKNEFKTKKLKLEDAIRNNKTLRDNLRRLTGEVKGTQEEIEKNIRAIKDYKIYADFIVSILGRNKVLENTDLSWINLQSKDKDIELMLEKIFKIFGFIFEEDDVSLIDEKTQKNENFLTTLFYSLESNVMKGIEILDGTKNKMYQDRNKYEGELRMLDNRLKELHKEYDEFKNELKLEQFILGPNVELETNLEDYNELLNDLYDALVFYDINEKKKYKKEETVTTKTIKKNNLKNDILVGESIKLMKKKEKTLNLLFKQMEEIEKDPQDKEGYFRKLVERVKNENRINKYIEIKEINRKLQEEKNARYQQRQNRININNPKTYNPPWLFAKKIDDDKDKNKEEDEHEMIIYDK